MKKGLLMLLAVLLLSGCAMDSEGAEGISSFRENLANARTVSFGVEILADYIDTVERFSLDCHTDSTGLLTFRVTDPEEIRDISGTVSADTGSLSFEDTVLAFPLMVRERISPVSGPWLVIHALKTGYLTAWVREGELLHVTLEEDLNGTTVTVDAWLLEDAVASGEISWQGVRQMSLQFRDFSMK